MNKVRRSDHKRGEITGQQILSDSIIKFKMPKSDHITTNGRMAINNKIV
jgi:hypothetical protein